MCFVDGRGRLVSVVGKWLVSLMEKGWKRARSGIVGSWCDGEGVEEG